MSCQGLGEPTGLEQVMELVKARDDFRQPTVKDGYVDVLGVSDAIGPYRGQQVFKLRFVAAIYELLWRPLVSRFFFGLLGPGAAKERRMTMEMLKLSPGDRVLDVGCGPGNYTRHIAITTGDGLAVGIDASEAMVVRATRLGGANLAYVRGDAGELPFVDGQFDAAFSVGVIHMLEDPERAIAEMARVLAPGGRLAIVASCDNRGRAPRARSGVRIFGKDELTGILSGLGLIRIEQHLMRRSQFVAARKAVA